MGFLHFVFSLLFLVFSGLLVPSVYGNSEVRALMEMKASLDPENRVLFSWTSDADPCSNSFEGVHCNEHRKVANITLQAKGLSGKVPPAVAGLRCLSGLFLHYNSLSGEIPREISGLTELSELYLDFNNLSGAIPPEIGNMGSLQGWLKLLGLSVLFGFSVILNFLFWDFYMLVNWNQKLQSCLKILFLNLFSGYLQNFKWCLVSKRVFQLPKRKIIWAGIQWKLKKKSCLSFWVHHLRHSAYLDISYSFAAWRQPFERADTSGDRFLEETWCYFLARK